MENFRLPELRQPAKAYVEFLRTAHLSLGVYRLAAGAQDLQQPHGEEEVYYVAAGRARFHAGADDIPVAPGDVLYVPPAEPHRFHSIEEDLELLVFFAPPEGAH